MHIGERIKAARGSLSQQELAFRVHDLLGEVTATSTVHRWEKSGLIRADRLVAVAVALDADPGWLLTGEGSAPPGAGGDESRDPDAPPGDLEGAVRRGAERAEQLRRDSAGLPRRRSKGQ